MLRLFALLLFTSLSIPVLGQFRSKLVPAELITVGGDTLRGNVRVLRQQDLFRSPRFVDSTGHKQWYYPNELRGYTVGDQAYRSVKLPGEYYSTFVKVRVAGKVTLLEALEYPPTDSDPDGRYSNGPSHSKLYLQRGNGELVWVNIWRFRKQLKAYFADRPDLGQAIANRTYRYRNLDELVRRYNEGR